MKAVVMRNAGPGGGVISLDPGSDPAGSIGQYLCRYDPAFGDGLGLAEWTADPQEAIHFESFAAAFKYWRAVSPAFPIRADGRPNRPLTAYHVLFDVIEVVPAAFRRAGSEGDPK